MKIKVFGTLNPHHHPQIKQAGAQAIADLPASIRMLLQNHTLNIGQRLSDIDPDMADKKIGDNIDLSYAEAALGFCSYADKSATIIQETKENTACTQGSYTYAAYNAYKTALHEIGHLFSRATKTDLALSPQILTAYAQDMQDTKSLPHAQRESRLQQMAYYLTTADYLYADHITINGAIGEVFAEAFANIIGGFNNNFDSGEEECHYATFPRTYAVVEEIIKSFAPSATFYPTHNRLYPTIDLSSSLSRLAKPFLNHAKIGAPYAAKSPTTGISTVLAANTAIKFSAT